MKKKLLFFPCLLAVLLLHAQNYTGVKISYYGFACQQGTADDILGLDGAGDEIFMSCFTKSVFGVGMKPTKIFGDTRIPGVRSLAGSASAFGGIKSGDLVRVNELYDFDEKSHMVLLNNNIGPNNYAIIIPTIWESDDGMYNSAFSNWEKVTSTMLNDDPFLNTITAASKTINFSNAGDFTFLLPGRYYGLDAAYSNTFASISNKPGTRPVGIMQDLKTFSSQIMLITQASAIAMAQYDFGYGKGIVPVLYNEVSMGNTAYHGIYRMLLKVEISGQTTMPVSTPAPAPKPAAVPVPAPAPVNNSPVAITAKKEISTTASSRLIPVIVPMNNELLYGVWSGTKGTSNSATDEPFSFKFNNNVCWLLKPDGSGIAIGSGGYSIANGNFTAACTDTNNMKWEIKSTGVNTSTNQLSGTWSCTGPNYFKTGLWTAKKISN